jgi:Tfp pilus assembly protein PilF
MTVRVVHCVVLICVLTATACVAVNRRSGLTSDESLRSIFQRQKQGAFNALADDPRIEKLRNRLNADAADFDSRLELASVYESYRLYDRALEQYAAAFDLRRAEKAIFGIVRCDQALNRTWQAIPLLEQFVKESPSGSAWHVLGLLYDAAGDRVAGEGALRNAVASNESSDEWHNNLGYNLMWQSKEDAAEIEFRRALELNPKSATAHNNLGTLLARRGKFEAALAEFEFAADPPTAHNNLAVVLMEMKMYEESRGELVKALAMRRNFAPALANFKLVQERVRQRTEVQKAGRPPQSNVRVASAEQEAGQSKQPEDQ